MEWILRVRGLSKIYGRGCPECIDLTGPGAGSNICPRCRSIVALRDVSFELSEGEILGIVGESGSGKSTLVQCLYFDTDPTSGEAYLSADPGKNLFTLPRNMKRSIRNKQFGMVYQNARNGLRQSVTCGGNIAEKLLASERFVYREMRSRALELLSRTELPGFFLDRKPWQLSGGMQQRVQIAKALANNPPVIFLDEVSTGLDLSVQARILDLIRELSSGLSVSMIIVSHDLGVIRLLTNRTMVMKNGSVIESGLTDQILEDPQSEYAQVLVHSMI